MTAADALAGLLVVALNAYVLSGGADFGGGVWDLLASGRRKAAQRDLVARAIGPVWEANHVWLILAVVLLFTCFPAAFARLAVTLNLPLTGVLVGVVLRGSAFAFRGYGGDRDVVQRRWGRVFAVASLVTPVLLGVAVGAVASGAVGDGGRRNGARVCRRPTSRRGWHRSRSRWGCLRCAASRFWPPCTSRWKGPRGNCARTSGGGRWRPAWRWV